MKYSIFSLVAFCYLQATAQSLPDSVIKNVDSIFSKWNDPNSPGCAVGIIRDDSLVYAKGYGMANLEYNISITPETPFHMASVSKQFTAYSIMLLARKGKLKLDDDVRKYLPWFPDLGAKITIQQLLNHTSGVRDQWQLLAISGTRLDDVITQKHIVKILSKQQALNFKPNEKSSYSNSGYTMLAEIVKAVTGQTLRKFTDSAIFKPLGMTTTHFHDDCTEIEKNRSYSYDRLDSAHFVNSILSYSNAGATSLFTNIRDLSKWVMHFYTHPADDQVTIDMLTKKSKLNSGEELNYANGIVVDTHNGWRQFTHAGGDAGYRTYLSVFPDQKMGFLVFSNLGDVNVGGLTYAVVDLFIKDTTKTKVPPKDQVVDSLLGILKDSTSMRKFVGDYIGEDGLNFNLEISRGKLLFHIFGDTNILAKGVKDTFYMVADPTVRFVFRINGRDTTTTILTSDETYYQKKYVQDTTVSDGILKKYTGKYYCPELDCTYRIILKDHGLVLTNSKYDDAKLKLVGTDHLLNDHWWINHLLMLRDANKIITGFEVNSGRIMHLRFNKVP